MIAAALLLAVAIAQAPDCSRPGRNTPAHPVPECVTATGAETRCSTAGAIRLWPSDMRPALLGQVPADRDSTDRVVGRPPTRRSGHESFAALATITASPRRLIVGYSVGIQIRSIEGPDAVSPRTLASADGWEGEWLDWGPVPSEAPNLIEGVAALRRGGVDLIATAGAHPVMASIWSSGIAVDPRSGAVALRQLYQDEGTGRAYAVRLVTHHAVPYVLVAGAEGVQVYDAARALALAEPCVGRPCGGVYRGRMITGERQHLDVAIVDGAAFVAASFGHGFQRPPLELWRVEDLARPTERRDRRALVREHAGGVALMLLGERLHLAWISEARGLDREDLVIADVDACRTAPCAPVELHRISIDPPAADYATTRDPLRWLGGSLLWRPLVTGGLQGRAQPQAWRAYTWLGRLELDEVGADGGRYEDPCHRWEIDYRSHRYTRNARGLNENVPGDAALSGALLYVAGGSVLDVHRLGPPPRIFGDGFESGGLGRWRR